MEIEKIQNVIQGHPKNVPNFYGGMPVKKATQLQVLAICY